MTNYVHEIMLKDGDHATVWCHGDYAGPVTIIWQDREITIDAAVLLGVKGENDSKRVWDLSQELPDGWPPMLFVAAAVEVSRGRVLGRITDFVDNI